MVEPIVEYFTSQTPLVLISVMGLGVAGLALVFGIMVVSKSPKSNQRGKAE